MKNRSNDAVMHNILLLGLFFNVACDIVEVLAMPFAAIDRKIAEGDAFE
jgi:hypothetical protein